MNIEPTVERGRTVLSLKSEHTVHCERKTFSSILYAYESSFAKGEMVLDLDWILRHIQTETRPDVIWRKYGKSSKDWFK